MKADERIRSVPIASIPHAVLVVARDGHVVAANPVAGRLFDTEAGTLVGVRVDELVPQRFRVTLQELTEELVDSSSRARAVRSSRELFVLRDDREVPVEIAAGPAGDGEHLVVVVRDISKAVVVKDELARSEYRFRVAAEVAADVIYDADVENDLQGWVGDIDKLTGYGPGEFPRTISGAVATVHPDDRQALQAVIDRAIEAGRGFDTKYRVRRPDGSYMFVRETAQMVETAKGRVTRAIGVLTDVTDEVLAKQELERAVVELTALKKTLQAESRYLQNEIKSHHNFEEIIGQSPALKATLSKVELVAPTDATVLLLGETGTGKELLARAIHARSKRSDRPLIKVDCGTLPEGLIQSELFGHVKGAFTGAHESKAGRFELAHEGTIFLDEIGELPLPMQPELLRVLDDGEMRRVGSKEDRTVDVRVIAATNRDLKEAVRTGRFRSDLYYRLGVFPIESPPLRDRREDIPVIASFFASRSAATVGRSISRIDRVTMDDLMAYDWPGNVRELRNVIERAVILCRGETLKVEERLGGAVSRAPSDTRSFKRGIHAIEREQILEALKGSNWKVKGTGGAADRLGLKPSTLRSRMQRLGISRP